MAIDKAMSDALKNKMKSKKDETIKSFGLDSEPTMEDTMAHPGAMAKKPVAEGSSSDMGMNDDQGGPDDAQEESGESMDEKKQELLDAVDALASTPKENLEEAIASLKDMIEQAY